MFSLFQAEIAKTSSPEFNTEHEVIMEAEINATDNIFLYYLQLYRSRSTIVVYESSIVLILSLCSHDSFFHLRYFQSL